MLIRSTEYTEREHSLDERVKCGVPFQRAEWCLVVQSCSRPAARTARNQMRSCAVSRAFARVRELVHVFADVSDAAGELRRCCWYLCLCLSWGALDLGLQSVLETLVSSEVRDARTDFWPGSD